MIEPSRPFRRRASCCSGYVAAIRRAIYIFAIYEWNVLHEMEINDLAHRFENYSIALRNLMKEIWDI
jgi:hypothetical protein